MSIPNGVFEESMIKKLEYPELHAGDWERGGVKLNVLPIGGVWLIPGTAHCR